MDNPSDLIDTWGDWTDEVVTHRHRCHQNHHDGVGILRRESGPTDFEGWILASMELTTEDDVNSGRAPAIGGVVRCSAIAISFCPFCGASLS